MFIVDGDVIPIVTRYYQRDRLPVDAPIDGPAIVLQTDSTTVIPPGYMFRRHSSGDLSIRIKATTLGEFGNG